MTDMLDQPMQAQRLVSAVKGVLPNPADSSGLTMATILSVDALNRQATVGWGGSSAPSGPFVYAGGCYPAVGEGCYLAPLGNGAWLIVATTGEGWTFFASADLSFSVAGYAKGNATINAWYRVDSGVCDYYGQYIVGTTTFFPNGIMSLILPFATARNDGGPIGQMYGIDSSAGGVFPGSAYGQGTNLAGLESGANPAQPWSSPNSAAAQPFGAAWAVNDQARWNLRFRF
jgi:hypothetical protein